MKFQCCFLLCLMCAFIGTSLADNLCLAKGGVCRPPNECMEEVSEPTAGLCQDSSYKCCHGVSATASKCHEFGGECMESCGIVESRAVDCQNGDKCCILV